VKIALTLTVAAVFCVSLAQAQMTNRTTRHAGTGARVAQQALAAEELLAAQQLAAQQASLTNPYAGGGYGGGSGGYSSLSGEIATTPIQGIDYGIAHIIRAAGDYNLQSSQAVLNLTEAQKKEIENWKLFTTTYFELRRLNREYQALERGPKPSQTELIHIAQMGKPRRLTPSEVDNISGQIAWPIVLQAVEFAPYRTQLERIYADRAAHGMLGLDEYLTADRLTAMMTDVLRRHIFDVPPADYMTSRRFLESLAFESRFPAI
jgi:hypothetical protein